MRVRLTASTASIVCMLCSRSASLTRITRTSRVIASSIFRNDSACDSSRVEKRSLSSLVRPSTKSAVGAPKRSISSALLMPQSSIASCISAAMIAWTSSFHSAQMPATANVSERAALDGDLFQHIDADLAGRDLAQRRDAGLVLGLHLGCMTLAQHARAIRRREHELEAIGNLGEAVFDSDAGHGESGD